MTSETETEITTDLQYEFTTIDYEHPDPRYRTPDHVSVRLQMNYEELVAGARIEVGDLV